MLSLKFNTQSQNRPLIISPNVLQTYNWEYTAYTWKDLLVKYNGVSLAYDSNGQITSLNGMSLSWHDLGLLSSAGSTTYTYDTSGKRLSKTVNGVTTNFYYAGDLLVGQKTGNDIIEFMFDSKGDYFGLEYNGTPYYYIKNLQGDVIAICNNAGNTVVTYEYDAWGRLMSYTDTTGINLVTKNPIRYRGYYLDHETGFYYLKSRYYSAEICRFLSPDVYVSTGQGILGNNMFAYCNNNPIMYIDETGTRHVKGTDACGISTNLIVQEMYTYKGSSYNYGVTSSFGFTASYSSGKILAGKSVMLSTDTHNFAIQKSYSDGSTTTDGVSAGIFAMITNANSIDHLTGESFTVGGTIVLGKGLSIDYVEFSPDGYSTCHGYVVTYVFGANVDLHEYTSHTTSIIKQKGLLEYLLEKIWSN